MKHTRNLAIFVMAALASLAAFATGTLDPLLQLVGLQPEGVLPLLMLANAPLGAELKTLVEGIQAGFADVHVVHTLGPGTELLSQQLPPSSVNAAHA